MALIVLPLGVEDRDIAKARRHRAMGDRRGLHRLALAATEGPAEIACRAVAEPVHRIPELLGLRLVGDVAQHGAALAVLDLVEELPAELEIVALLVDAPAAVPDDVDPVLDPGDEIVEARFRGVRAERDIRHALDRKGGRQSA